MLMAAGQMAGGWLTAHYASRSRMANIWAHRLLVVIVIVAIIKLFGWHQAIFDFFAKN
jgi:hypothetical protein